MQMSYQKFRLSEYLLSFANVTSCSKVDWGINRNRRSYIGQYFHGDSRVSGWLLTVLRKKWTLCVQSWQDEIPSELNNISYYSLILLYRIITLTDITSDKRINEYLFQVRISPNYDHAYMHVFFFKPCPAKLNEVMHKICVLSHRNHITLLLHG